MKIKLSIPHIGLSEMIAVNKVLRSSNLSQGEEVFGFENDFSRIVGDRQCVAVNSGTSALHISLLSLGIGHGDEVIVPSFTFAATANVVKLVGATPVFVDINESTYNIDEKLLVNFITKRTRAIIVVHLYGLPANMGEILKIAKSHNLFLVEDAAQAHLAEFNGQAVGTFGHAAAFSFYATKNMTTGEGGMAVFSSDKLARNARLLRNQGMETRYKNEIIGFNLRMTNIHAAIGRVQLKKLPSWTDKRIENAMYLTNKLANFLKVPEVPKNIKHVFHQYTVRVPANKRSLLIENLNSMGIESGIYYPIPVHELSPFKDRTFNLPVTEIATKEVLSLPVQPRLNRKELNRIVASTVQGIA
jgi:perosamine synthetase